MHVKTHWERVYQNSSVDKLGWHESKPEPSLSLIYQCKLPKDAAILNVGAGATTLIDELLILGYQNIMANDISESALKTLQKRLGPAKRTLVRWIVDDLTNPNTLLSLGPVDLWHDRAVLHFLHDSGEQAAYFNLLRRLVKNEAYVIIAAFNLDGAERCSGLPVFRYDASILKQKLGDEFHLQEAFDYTYTMPSGDTREYIYTLFQRKKL